MNASKDIEKNKQFRADILEKCKNDEHIRNLVTAKCAEDCIFFIDTFGWTFNPRLQEPEIPFILYDFQEQHIKEIIACIEHSDDMIYDKSRDMGASWMAVAIQIWGFLFKKWSQLYGSYKEDYVDQKGNMDSHFERLRFFISRLPRWLKPVDLVDKYMTLSSQSLGVDISGDAGENFGTGGRRKAIWLDEFSLWQYDRTAFRKTRDITNCRIFFGTPNGRFNVFGKIMTNDREYKHIQIKKKSLLWKLHPLKTQEWYEAEKLKRTKLDMAREIDLSYDDSIEGAVYNDFQKLVTFGEYEFDPNLRLYTGWDFGRDMTSIIWFQKDFKTNTIYVIDAFQKSGTDIDFFVAFIIGEPTQGYQYTKEELKMIDRHKLWKHTYANHYGDPYNADSSNVLSENTIRLQLQKYGIYIKTNRDSTLEGRIKKTELAMRRMYVNGSLTDFIQAIIQSRYPQVREGSQATTERTKPVHDVNSHYRTALEYFIDNEPQPIENQSTKVFEEKLKKIRRQRRMNNFLHKYKKI